MHAYIMYKYACLCVRPAGSSIVTNGSCRLERQRFITFQRGITSLLLCISLQKYSFSANLISRLTSCQKKR